MSNVNYTGQGGAPGTTPNSGTSPLVTVNQLGVQALNAIVAAIKAVFPQLTGTSGTASAGSATLPAAPAGFVDVTLPSGAQVKLPYYNP